MIITEKVAMVKVILDDSTLDDVVVSAYLEIAEKEILAWRYGGVHTPSELPSEFDMIQVHAVVVGYTQRGAEGQTWHSEGNIMRTFIYGDMLKYIHMNVTQICGVPS